MSVRSDIMNKFVTATCVGFLIGVYIGYSKEEQLETMYRKSCKKKRKVLSEVHKAYDDICDCMHE